MDPVTEKVLIPPAAPGPHASDLEVLAKILLAEFFDHGFRLNRVLPKDGTEAMTAPLVLAEYTVATLPTASDWEGGVIYVSDGAAGQKFRGSDGTSWVNLG